MSVTRRFFITPSFESRKNIKTVPEQSKPGEFLFGKGIAQKVKDATALDKLAGGVKPQGSGKATQTKNF